MKFTLMTYVLNILIKKMHNIIIFFIFILTACNSSNEKLIKNNYKYLFLGHPYQYGVEKGNRIDNRLADLDKSIFDQIWLGGDVCSNTNLEIETLYYLDSIFNIKSPYTYWTLGNHDIMYQKNDFIEKATGKRTFYANYNNGFTVLQINSNLDNLYLKYKDPDLCKCRDEQYELIKTVCDTISNKSSHLVFLMHHVLWYDIDPNASTYANFIHKKWMAKCDSTSNFTNDIYPLLKKVQNRNIQVICIAGDVGMYGKQGFFKDSENIVYLGSGINNSSIWDEKERSNALKDKVLILNHDFFNKKITWSFSDLDSLLISQKK